MFGEREAEFSAGDPVTEEAPLPPLLHDNCEWKDPNGQVVQLCAPHELWDRYNTRVPAVTTVLGFAVCRMHLTIIQHAIKVNKLKPKTVIMRLLEGEM
jgi:hypothetical protein